MNNNLTEMIFIMDRSGSMRKLVSDTIGGYNSMIDKQRNEDGEASVTTVLFDDQYEILYDNVDIKKVAKLTNKEYCARGMTALLDAIGKTINQVAARHNNSVDSAVPAKTVVVIITDGMENASKEYKLPTVKSMIEKQKKQLTWMERELTSVIGEAAFEEMQLDIEDKKAFIEQLEAELKELEDKIAK